ncbi:MAG: sigma-70 family RNA polymerase sigma factor [Lentisphaeraceae bacterium]|nr:sigma-70 family RNA polymerase sigma factor [Lentisphaeraceae bacterium]
MTDIKEDLPDKQLIALYLGKDDGAFEILYERYKNAVYSYLNKLLPGQTALVDDLFQQAWMKVVVNMSKYKDDSNFLAWVLRIARNLSIDHFRKESRKKTAPLVEDMDAPGSILDLPSSELEHGELGQAIAQAVETLPLEQREVFVLRQQNVPFKEIAVIQETTLNTTLGRMHYAVDKLRSKLKGWL